MHVWVSGKPSTSIIHKANNFIPSSPNQGSGPLVEDLKPKPPFIYLFWKRKELLKYTFNTPPPPKKIKIKKLIQWIVLGIENNYILIFKKKTKQTELYKVRFGKIELTL